MSRTLTSNRPRAAASSPATTTPASAPKHGPPSPKPTTVTSAAMATTNGPPWPLISSATSSKRSVKSSSFSMAPPPTPRPRLHVPVVSQHPATRPRTSKATNAARPNSSPTARRCWCCPVTTEKSIRALRPQAHRHSLSQAARRQRHTIHELGTVYSVAELKAIWSMCKKLGLHMHMDGALRQRRRLAWRRAERNHMAGRR